ncbi:O-glucosyltransferase Rumi [Tanacetum coccineum]
MGSIAESLWRVFNGNGFVARVSKPILFSLLFCAFYLLYMFLDDDPTLTISKSMHNLSQESGLKCLDGPKTSTCPENYYPKKFKYIYQGQRPAPGMCPEYFRWIYEDLRPWAATGITLEMVERANRTANFRLVIIDGRAYVEVYEKGFQTRDTMTLWGILQLLRRFPGRIPDLDLMFDCVDWPVIQPDGNPPPPLFRFCGDNNTLDIVFPDWTFWGWPETNIRPWERLSHDIILANEKSKWKDREPYAYWKGNPIVAKKRMELLECNVSKEYDWNARIYAQNWRVEVEQGFKNSSLTNQCNHRYKIYIEGSAWSVSRKYILACDSVTLMIKPHYYDFFSRGLMPMHHYWPIRNDDKCKSIKFAVDWGNKHRRKVKLIGKNGSKFIKEELSMDNVYNYMFHLLNEYSKLLKYKPTVPPQAVELCSESMACPERGVNKAFMMESLVKEDTSDVEPCTIPQPYDPSTLYALLKRKESILSRVQQEEKVYWDRHS